MRIRVIAGNYASFTVVNIIVKHAIYLSIFKYNTFHNINIIETL